jgi:hypothetical protein
LLARSVPGAVRAELRAGVAVFNAGEHHAAHDAWEERWLALPDGDDADLLQGLIQFTAAVHHAGDANWDGLRGLADSAGGYLAGLPADCRGVNVGDVRGYVGALAADPEHVERASPPALTHEGAALALADLRFDAAAVAARVLAGEYDGYDPEVLARAAEYGRADLDDGRATSPFVTLVLDFARGGDRPIVHQRLSEHVARRDREHDDVAGLFDVGEEP